LGHDGDRRGYFLGREGFEAMQLPLDFVGIRSHGVQPHHLDGTGCLMHVVSGVNQGCRGRRVGRERRERLEAASERLVDLALDPGQGAQVEVGCGLVRHGGQCSGKSSIGMHPAVEQQSSQYEQQVEQDSRPSS